ncbi:pilus assembly protein PilM, partial [Candidatus Saccharibacteria bacterium]|nr:pilus assembly protein PilM [Candidatus Saccharibacteria bacterium]
AIKPSLDVLIDGIEKSIRYYSERAAKNSGEISQVITVGGGSVMPGFTQYLSRELHLPTQNLDPWQIISFGQLTMPAESDRAGYIIAAGEALVDPAETLI